MRISDHEATILNIMESGTDVEALAWRLIHDGWNDKSIIYIDLDDESICCYTVEDKPVLNHPLNFKLLKRLSVDDIFWKAYQNHKTLYECFVEKIIPYLTDDIEKVYITDIVIACLDSK